MKTVIYEIVVTPLVCMINAEEGEMADKVPLKNVPDFMLKVTQEHAARGEQVLFKVIPD